MAGVNRWSPNNNDGHQDEMAIFRLSLRTEEQYYRLV